MILENFLPRKKQIKQEINQQTENIASKQTTNLFNWNGDRIGNNGRPISRREGKSKFCQQTTKPAKTIIC